MTILRLRLLSDRRSVQVHCARGSRNANGFLDPTYRRRVNVAEVFLLVAAVALPLLLGLTAALLRKPWWWAACLGVVIVMVAMIAPQPEPGESRVAVGDLPFLLVVALLVVGLVWLAYYLARRLWVRRREPRRAAAP
jgi:hypothetical protein